MSLPDTRLTTLLNIGFNITATGNTSGADLIGPGYDFVQPTTDPISKWCSSGFCNLDLLSPTAKPVYATVYSGPVGLKGEPGCAVGTTGCVAVVVGTPTANQTINQPAGTTLGVTSLNNVLVAGTDPITDLGVQVNAMIARRGTSCGTIAIAPGNDTFMSQIVQPRCMTIEGNNAVLIWAGPATVPAIVIGSANGSGANYSQGGLLSLKLFGSSTSNGSVGIWLGGGGSSTAHSVPANLQEYLETFQNVNVTGFGNGWAFGSNVYQVSWFGSSATHHGCNRHGSVDGDSSDLQIGSSHNCGAGLTKGRHSKADHAQKRSGCRERSFHVDSLCGRGKPRRQGEVLLHKTCESGIESVGAALVLLPE